MATGHVYDPERNLVTWAIVGPMSTTGLQDVLSGVLADSAIAPGFVEAVDLSGVTSVDLSYEDSDPFRPLCDSVFI